MTCQCSILQPASCQGGRGPYRHEVAGGGQAPIALLGSQVHGSKYLLQRCQHLLPWALSMPRILHPYWCWSGVLVNDTLPGGSLHICLQQLARDTAPLPLLCLHVMLQTCRRTFIAAPPISVDNDAG